MSRVLIADDNLTVQRMVASVLRGEGMSVTVVDSGPAALDAARSDPPDLILADFDLEGMNVAAFASRARKDTHMQRPIPIVVMMSPNDSCDADRLTAMGVQASIRKPLDSDLLRQAVNKWIPVSSAETAVISNSGRWTFPPPIDNGLSLSQPTHHSESTNALRLNNTGETTPSLADPSSPMVPVPMDIPAMMSIEPTVLSDTPEGAPSDPTPLAVDLSPGIELAQFEAPDPILSADIPEAKAEEAVIPCDIMVSEEASPTVSKELDLSPVFCPMVAPVVAEVVDEMPAVDVVCEANVPSPIETPPVVCEMPSTPTPPAPEISAADLHAAVEAEISARLPEIIRAILTPEMVQTALAKAAHEIVPAMAEVQLPETVRAILAPETVQAALARVAREVVPPLAVDEIVKEIQRLESKIS